jgi:hypothetical protein
MWGKKKSTFSVLLIQIKEKRHGNRNPSPQSTPDCYHFNLVQLYPFNLFFLIFVGQLNYLNWIFLQWWSRVCSLHWQAVPGTWYELLIIFYAYCIISKLIQLLIIFCKVQLCNFDSSLKKLHCIYFRTMSLHENYAAEKEMKADASTGTDTWVNSR